MILKDDTVLLRDFKREDIAKRIEWETEQTEWQLWDGPWEYEGLTEEQKKENLQKYIKALEEWAAICESLSDEMPRKSFQICTPEGEYVGWCSSYFINEDYDSDKDGDRLAIGIDLPVMSEWSYPRLKIAPCRQFGSSRTDDLVIAAHNYESHFGKLTSLTAGDSVTFTDMDGIVNEYVVNKVEVLDPHSVEEVEHSGYALVLYTCTYGGKTRVTVFCDRAS